MALSKDELNALSDNTPEEIKEWMPTLSPEDISALYDLEVAKEQPRPEVVELLMAETNNIDPDAPTEPAKPTEVKPVEGALNKNKPYHMVWHKGDKCIMQNNKVYNSVSNELIEEL